MEKANQAPVFDLEIAACEITDMKNLLTAVQWWMAKLMECKTEKDAGSVFLVEGKIYDSIIGAVQANLAQLQQGMDAAAEHGYEVLKREKVQA